MTLSWRKDFPLWSLVVYLALVTAFLIPLAQRFYQPFPPLAETLSSATTELQDFVGIALGCRRLAADISWIETLEYYGTDDPTLSDFDQDQGRGHYPLLLAYCERTTRIDPYFTYVYYYGAGALGWNMNLLSDAQALLKEGIAANPTEWRLKQYLAAMSYENNHDSTQIAAFLESFLYQPDCPNLLRSILANIYKKQKRYRDAIRVWLVVADSNDPGYVATAKRRIADIMAIDPALAYLRTGGKAIDKQR